MASSRFLELKKRIEDLRGIFLPSKWEPTGLYEEAVYEHTRAFRVLAHAEFESYIEDRVIEIADQAVVSWENEGKISLCLLAMVAYRESAPSIPISLDEAAAKRAKYPTLEERIEAARTDIHKYARNQNNGIKEKNLLRLLLPIGLAEDELNTVWISDTQTWATTRGDSAHQSAKIQVNPNPQNELSAVMRVLKGFQEVDDQMNVK